VWQKGYLLLLALIKVENNEDVPYKAEWSTSVLRDKPTVFLRTATTRIGHSFDFRTPREAIVCLVEGKP
jgi:hypothetical protein